MLPIVAEPPGAASTPTPAFSFAHLSDPHLSSLQRVSGWDLLNKRLLGYLSWRSGRRAEHRREVLAALERDLQQRRPDHIVVTGDLTHIGLPEEFIEVGEWLRTVGDPADVTVIPGNHDAYVRTSWERTFAHWLPYMASDVPVSAAGELFPSVRIRSGIAFIGLSTAWPAPLFLATGRLGTAQLQRLARVLAETGRAGLVRVVLVHHPPLPESVKWRKRLIDSPALQRVLIEHGAELILHGHLHRSTRGVLATPRGAIPVIGVPSASARGRREGRRAEYHLYRIDRTAGGWELAVTIRGYAPAEDRFVAAGEWRLPLPAHPPV